MYKYCYYISRHISCPKKYQKHNKIGPPEDFSRQIGEMRIEELLLRGSNTRKNGDVNVPPVTVVKEHRL